MAFRNNVFTARNRKIRTLQLLNLVLSIAGIVFFSTKPWIAIAFFLYFMFLCVGVNIGAHRYFSHRSFNTRRVREIFLGIFMCLATVGSPLAWANMHHSHHKHSDTSEDPHTPIISGKQSWSGHLRAFIGAWSKQIELPFKTSLLRRQKMHKIFHFYYFLVIAVYALLLTTMFGFVGLVFAYCLPATFTFIGAGLIVTLGHSSSDRHESTGDFTTNSKILHVLTWGEGLHYEHHRSPGKYLYQSPNMLMSDLPGMVIHHFLKV